VVCGFIAAYNAKKLGVKHFVMQYMMNTPSGISPEMDLAKMLAKIELVESLHSIEFTSYRMIRTGLASMSKDMNVAKGQLASSVTIGMALKPHIIHVVGYTEGDHAAKASEVIESCKIIKGVVGNCLLGLPDLSNNERIIHRKDFLLKEANILLDSIKKIDPSIREPLISPDVLSKAIKIGLLDAPLLKGLTCANGELITKIINGCNCSVIPDTGEVIGEQERTEMLLRKYENIQKKRTRLKE
jgi:hypothetical protein